MGVFNGTAQIITFAGVQLAELTECSMTMEANLFEVTSKESAGYAEFLSGLRTITYSASGLTDYQATNKDMADLFAAYEARAAVSIVWTNAVTGDKKVTQNAFITSITNDAPMEDKASYTLELTGTGAPTIATI